MSDAESCCFTEDKELNECGLEPSMFEFFFCLIKFKLLLVLLLFDRLECSDLFPTNEFVDLVVCFSSKDLDIS